ncbi:hypothetical protein HGRIS_006097 [Hohenbuehelia grisea]|uniref:Uncharacterized protein n=1 Tax=Hohenbuehelia grisea TaxID=104357 RepID=A0ABR3K1E6_9AGAR
MLNVGDSKVTNVGYVAEFLGLHFPNLFTIITMDPNLATSFASESLLHSTRMKWGQVSKLLREKRVATNAEAVTLASRAGTAEANKSPSIVSGSNAK